MEWKTDWNFKIYAYLHDPPDKPLCLARKENHESWGRELAQFLTQQEWKEEWGEPLVRADQLASGADRSGLIAPLTTDFRDLRHPLSGQLIELPQFGELGPEAARAAKEALKQEFRRWSGITDPSAAFVALWKFIPAALRKRRGPYELGALWDLLPADTRMPHHPVSAHMALTCAIASLLYAGQELALLSFSIGPVQAFIAQARKTSDLFAGSFLLSEAILQAMSPLVEELGPDHIIFPSLRDSNLFEQWLQKDSRWKETFEKTDSPSSPKYGMLPNRFVALVPLQHAGTFAERCETKVRTWFRSEAEIAAKELEGRIEEFAGFSTMAAEQADSHLQVIWSVSPWPAPRQIATPEGPVVEEAAWALGGKLPANVAHFIQAAQKQNSYKPNGGILYGSVYASVERLQDSAKRTRLPYGKRSREGGLKCSLCAVRSVYPKEVPFEEQRSIWRNAVEKFQYLRRGEALCGICWLKRWKGHQDFRTPSTAEIAASPFKNALLDRYDELREKCEKLADAVEGTEWAEEWTVPELASRDPAGLRRVSGEALLATLRERTAEDTEISEEKLRNIRRASRNLREAARKAGVQPPRPYLAVLTFDGDEIGKWLSGEKNQPLKNYLSQSIVQHLKDSEEILKCRWPITPAGHASLSQCCSVFSQSTAPFVLHQSGFLGQLIYSGGDDVLGLLPVGIQGSCEIATEAALQLRLRFSGHMKKEGNDYFAEPQEKGSGFVWNKELGMAFGSQATASASLVVFHQKTPLRRALAEAHRSLDAFAKEKLGRNALAITILRRSGQITRTGMRFLEKTGDKLWSPIRHFHQLCLAFHLDALSPRLLSEITFRLHSFDPGDRKSFDLARPLVRLAVERHFDKKMAGNQVSLEDLQQKVEELGEATYRFVNSRDPDFSQNLRPLHLWLDLIEAAVFLTRGEEP